MIIIDNKIFLVGCLEFQQGSPTFSDVDRIIAGLLHGWSDICDIPFTTNMKNTTKFISLLLLYLNIATLYMFNQLKDTSIIVEVYTTMYYA